MSINSSSVNVWSEVGVLRATIEEENALLAVEKAIVRVVNGLRERSACIETRKKTIEKDRCVYEKEANWENIGNLYFSECAW